MWQGPGPHFQTDVARRLAFFFFFFKKLCPLRDRTPEPCAPTAPLLLCVQLRPWEAVEAGALPGHRPGASGRWRPAAGTQSPRGSFSVQREDLGLGRSPELSREKPVRHPNPWPRFSTSQPLAQL